MLPLIIKRGVGIGLKEYGATLAELKGRMASGSIAVSAGLARRNFQDRNRRPESGDPNRTAIFNALSIFFTQYSKDE
jgi:hypothetical protein